MKRRILQILARWQYLSRYRKIALPTLALLLVFTTIISIIGSGPKKMVLGDSTKAWDINTSSDYAYDDTKIEFSGGVAQLKAVATPGTDWIATDGSGNNWGNRKKITFDNRTAILGVASENLVNFPVLIKLTSANIDYAKTQNSGQDIRFTDSNGATALKYEIEKWDETGSSYVWVKVPQIDINSNTDHIYIYYSNSTVADGQDSTNVWDNHSMVYHFKEAVGSGTSSDSTGNTSGVVTTNTVMGDAGQIGSAPTFTSGAGITSSATLGSPLLTAATTVSYWIYSGNVSSPSRQNPFNQAYGGWGTMTLETNGSISWFYGSNGGDNSPYTANASSASTVTAGAWINVTAVRNPVDFTYKWYKNGIYQSGSTYSNTYPVITSRTLTIGKGYANALALNGKMDEFRVAKFAETPGWVAATYKAESFGFNTIEDTPAYLFSTTSPTLVPNTGQGYSSLSAFSQTLGGGSTGTIKYQISPDNGVTWYWWSGAAWATTVAGYTEANISTDINSHIVTFTNGTNPKTFKWKAYFNSDGSQLPKLDAVNMTYVWDTADPDNPGLLASAKSQKTGGTDIATDTWSRYGSPYFTWSEPADNAGVGEVASGIAGYYVYFGTSATGDPHTSRGIATELGGSGVHYQTDRDFEVGVDTAAIATATIYYLRIETADAAGNVKDLAPEDPSLFIYKYDGTAPSSPLYASVSPSGYSRTNTFTFSWPIEGANAASDTGGSGLAGYQYKVSSGVWSDNFDAGTKVLNDAAESGVNIFYLRAIDNAGNSDATPIQSNFYFSSAAPTAPTSLQVDPVSADANVFSFTWGLPLAYNGSIAGYYYSINALPTPANITYTTDNFLADGPYATQQGENTLYLVAKDEAGNYDLGSCQVILGDPNIDSCSRVSFTANTSAPGIPTGLQIFDISNRDTQEYAVTLKWVAPVNKGTGFAGYEIYRSTDGLNYNSVGTTTGTTYADTELESTLYYYYVKSKDNAGQYSASSTAVSITPTGRYTSPPALVGESTAEVKSFSASVSWETDRESSSFVEYGTSTDKIGTAAGGETKGQLEETKDHTVSLKGLEPATTYYYQTVWVDSDGNRGESGVLNFLTKAAPRVSEVDSTSNVTLNSMLINWSTTVAAYCVVNYGPSVSYSGILREPAGVLASSHSLNLMALNHSTVYHFQVSCSDVDSNVFTSDDYKETTLTMPAISDFRFETVDAPTTTIKFTWKTNVPTTSIATYQASSSAVQSQSNADYKIDHEITIPDLSDKTIYILQAKGTDEHGNSCESDKNTFTTPNDTRPPKVSEMTVEIRSSGFGTTQKSQVVVAWKTDEPTASQVEYAQGISGSDYNFKTKEDSALSTNHVVIASDLDPSKIYHLRAVSRDSALNAGYSDDTTVITGKLQKSVIDIIINSLQTSLGWLFKIFQ